MKSREGLDLILEDDGIGIPADKKQSIFDYDEEGHCRNWVIHLPGDPRGYGYDHHRNRDRREGSHGL